MTAILTVLAFWLPFEGVAKPPKYFEGLPLRTCTVWPEGYICCGWRGAGPGITACNVGHGWSIVVDDRK